MVVGYRLKVANDVFNGRRDCPVLSSCHAVPMRDMAPCYRAAWHCSDALGVANGLALHCCGSAVTCQHVLLAFNTSFAARFTGLHDAVCPYVWQVPW
jgi:hypothetical protein